jgi:CRP/FNR family transcriptional regulator, cyclic AMP receptor protein
MNESTNSSGIPSGGSASVKSMESAMASHSFLADLKLEHLRMLADNTTRIHFAPDEFLFREGDPANRFYLIEHGRVSVESHRKDKPFVDIQTIGTGEVLGWSWLFPPYQWHFAARALEQTTAISFFATRLREQCENDHDLGYELMKRMTAVVIHRLQATRKQLLAART